MLYDDDEFCFGCAQWAPHGCYSTSCSHSRFYSPDIKNEELTSVYPQKEKNLEKVLPNILKEKRI